MTDIKNEEAGEKIRGELMRHLVVVEKRTFVSYEEVEKCVRDWLDRIN